MVTVRNTYPTPTPPQQRDKEALLQQDSVTQQNQKEKREVQKIVPAEVVQKKEPQLTENRNNHKIKTETVNNYTVVTFYGKDEEVIFQQPSPEMVKTYAERIDELHHISEKGITQEA